MDFNGPAGAPVGSQDCGRYEATHVHAVYDTIADHFSDTRYKPWPVVDRFLRDLPSGSVGVDAGCGNGKYLRVNPNVYILGSDRLAGICDALQLMSRSEKLVRIAAADDKNDVVIADALALCHPLGRFDFAISIAVVHHFAAVERRIAAIRAALDCLHKDGRLLVFAWALEQPKSRRGWSAEQSSQDVLVPWVLRPSPASPQGAPRTTLHRYYHLFRSGELEECVAHAGGVVIEHGYDRDNWWCIAKRGN